MNMDENELRYLQFSEQFVKEAEQLILEIARRPSTPAIPRNNGESMLTLGSPNDPRTRHLWVEEAPTHSLTFARNSPGFNNKVKDSMRLTLGSPNDPRTANEWEE